MQLDQKKMKTQRPTSGNGNASLELKDRKADVPEVGDLLDKIDKLLQKTTPRKQCGC